MSKECRTRIAAERASATPTQTTENRAVANNPTAGRLDRKTIVCFTCQQKGHKSPQCPQKSTRVKRIQIPRSRIVPLKLNELFGSIGGHSLPITCDSGANITEVPEECIREEEFTGEQCTIDTFNKVKVTGRKCKILVRIQDRIFA